MQNSNKALTDFFSASTFITSKQKVPESYNNHTKEFKMTSNTSGILMSRPHRGYRLAKQTEWGDEYVVFAYTAAEAWKKLSKITGRTVSELKSMKVTKVL